MIGRLVRIALLSEAVVRLLPLALLIALLALLVAVNRPQERAIAPGAPVGDQDVGADPLAVIDAWAAAADQNDLATATALMRVGSLNVQTFTNWWPEARDVYGVSGRGYRISGLETAGATTYARIHFQGDGDALCVRVLVDDLGRLTLQEHEGRCAMPRLEDTVEVAR